MAVAIKYNFKEWFLDREAVAARIDKTTRRSFMRIGGNVRTISQRSIRERKNASKRGDPPSSHEGSLRRLIFFVFDPQSMSVVIGPVGFERAYRDGDGKPLSGLVPDVLEHGGQVQRLERQGFNGQWYHSQSSKLLSHPRRFRVITIAERPFMIPALDKSKSRYADIWSATWSSSSI